MKKKADEFDIDAMAELATPLTGWVRPDRVAILLEERCFPWRPGREPHSLAERAGRLKLDASPVRRGVVAVRAPDLARLFSPEELDAVADDIESLQAETIDLRTARQLVGLTRLRDRELIGLLGRRGIPVSWSHYHGAVSLSACCWLGRLLVEERAWRPDPSDLFAAGAVLPLFRQAGPESVEGDGETLSASEELDRRCRLWDVRGPSKMVEEAWRETAIETACGYDLFRLCGVAMPGSDVAGYRRRLADAYGTVLGASAPDPAGPSESPAAAPGRIIRRGGRQIAVEEGEIAPVA